MFPWLRQPFLTRGPTVANQDPIKQNSQLIYESLKDNSKSFRTGKGTKDKLAEANFIFSELRGLNLSNLPNKISKLGQNASSTNLTEDLSEQIRVLRKHGEKIDRLYDLIDEFQKHGMLKKDTLDQMTKEYDSLTSSFLYSIVSKAMEDPHRLHNLIARKIITAEDLAKIIEDYQVRGYLLAPWQPKDVEKLSASFDQVSQFESALRNPLLEFNN